MAEYFIGITDKGKRREHNEDTFIAREFFKKGLVMACVIDGVGGYTGGEVAAAITRSVILDHFKNARPDFILGTLHAAIITANKKIQEAKKKNTKHEQMACVLTCAVADIRHNKLYYAHVGDTRLYLLRDHSLVKLSKDHSVVGFLEESGRLSEEDAMRHPRRNEITRALGFEEVVNAEDFIETGESPFLPGDIILVCSDGLSDMISSNTITSILLKQAGVTDKARELVAAANDAGGNDNITAVLVQNYNPPAPRVILKPAEKKVTKQKELVESDVSDEEKPVVPARRSRSLIVLLILLSLGLLSVLAFKKNAAEKEINTAAKAVKIKPTDANLDLLVNAATDSTKIHTIDPTASLLHLSAPIVIDKDSFYIRGNGVVISADSGYKGPAFIINNSAKKIVLDSITIKDFDVALIVRKNNITFKNVHFINCRVPMQYELSLPDTILSGYLKDSVFIQTPTFKKR